ncbi:uncharacterized protein LOC126195478 [Schistocerca nitens]|uniref:uncharacterized protein LOC126195478 n=1 Tax=Schistocerca nitens TaxID=7011 RepID=UPI0021193295|nr:uncharacterized protein LOC126195478 [Schistocerca nitens]
MCGSGHLMWLVGIRDSGPPAITSVIDGHELSSLQAAEVSSSTGRYAKADIIALIFAGSLRSQTRAAEPGADGRGNTSDQRGPWKPRLAGADGDGTPGAVQTSYEAPSKKQKWRPRKQPGYRAPDTTDDVRVPRERPSRERTAGGTPATREDHESRVWRARTGDGSLGAVQTSYEAPSKKQKGRPRKQPGYRAPDTTDDVRVPRERPSRERTAGGTPATREDHGSRVWRARTETEHSARCRPVTKRPARNRSGDRGNSQDTEHQTLKMTSASPESGRAGSGRQEEHQRPERTMEAASGGRGRRRNTRRGADQLRSAQAAEPGAHGRGNTSDQRGPWKPRLAGADGDGTLGAVQTSYEAPSKKQKWRPRKQPGYRAPDTTDDVRVPRERPTRKRTAGGTPATREDHGSRVWRARAGDGTLGAVQTSYEAPSKKQKWRPRKQPGYRAPDTTDDVRVPRERPSRERTAGGTPATREDHGSRVWRARTETEHSARCRPVTKRPARNRSGDRGNSQDTEHQTLQMTSASPESGRAGSGRQGEHQRPERTMEAASGGRGPETEHSARCRPVTKRPARNRSGDRGNSQDTEHQTLKMTSASPESGRAGSGRQGEHQRPERTMEAASGGQFELVFRTEQTCYAYAPMSSASSSATGVADRRPAELASSAAPSGPHTMTPRQRLKGNDLLTTTARTLDMTMDYSSDASFEDDATRPSPSQFRRKRSDSGPRLPHVAPTDDGFIRPPKKKQAKNQAPADAPVVPVSNRISSQYLRVNTTVPQPLPVVKTMRTGASGGCGPETDHSARCRPVTKRPARNRSGDRGNSQDTEHQTLQMTSASPESGRPGSGRQGEHQRPDRTMEAVSGGRGLETDHSARCRPVTKRPARNRSGDRGNSQDTEHQTLQMASASPESGRAGSGRQGEHQRPERTMEAASGGRGPETDHSARCRPVTKRPARNRSGDRGNSQDTEHQTLQMTSASPESGRAGSGRQGEHQRPERTMEAASGGRGLETDHSARCRPVTKRPARNRSGDRGNSQDTEHQTLQMTSASPESGRAGSGRQGEHQRPERTMEAASGGQFELVFRTEQTCYVCAPMSSASSSATGLADRRPTELASSAAPSGPPTMTTRQIRKGNDLLTTTARTLDMTMDYSSDASLEDDATRPSPVQFRRKRSDSGPGLPHVAPTDDGFIRPPKKKQAKNQAPADAPVVPVSNSLDYADRCVWWARTGDRTLGAVQTSYEAPSKKQKWRPRKQPGYRAPDTTDDVRVPRERPSREQKAGGTPATREDHGSRVWRARTGDGTLGAVQTSYEAPSKKQKWRPSKQPGYRAPDTTDDVRVPRERPSRERTAGGTPATREDHGSRVWWARTGDGTLGAVQTSYEAPSKKQKWRPRKQPGYRAPDTTDDVRVPRERPSRERTAGGTPATREDHGSRVWRARTGEGTLGAVQTSYEAPSKKQKWRPRKQPGHKAPDTTDDVRVPRERPSRERTAGGTPTTREDHGSRVWRARTAEGTSDAARTG